jgi:hypothetical protein
MNRKRMNALYGASVLSACVALQLITGCGAVDTLDKAVDEFSKARQDAVAQSDAWRSALPKLVEQLDQLEGQASADSKAVIADARGQVQEMVSDSIKFANINMQEGIAKAGVEMRCTTDSISAGVSSKLQYMIDDLKFWKKNKHHLDKKPAHGLCQIVGDTLALHSIGPNRFSIDSTKLIGLNIVGVFGYNFRPDALPHLALLDSKDALVRNLTIVPAYVSQYQLTIDFSTEAFAGATPGSRVRLVWPDGGEPNEITLSVVAPGKLRVTAHSFSPAAPVMGKDGVTLALTIQNYGGDRVNGFSVNWTPAEGRIQSLSQLALNAGESRQIQFAQPVVFHAQGRQRNDVTLSTGDSTEPFWLEVASNIASVEQHVIDKPPVDKPWTATAFRVHAGDKIEVVDAGGCVNTGGSGRTTKRYLDPKNGDCKDDSQYYGTIAVPGTIEQSARLHIRDFIAQSQKTPYIVKQDATIYLGYVDDGYGDNGYWGMDDQGTCDQCRGEKNAHLTLKITHYK